MFQTTKAATGLSAPSITAAMAKVISTIRSDWRNVRFKPSSGASMPLSSVLPSVVSRMTSGSLMPV